MRGNIVEARRRYVMGVILGGLAVLLLALCVTTALGQYRAGTASHAGSATVVVERVPLGHEPYRRARQVPVLVYHEMGNGCAPDAPTCKGPDPETVSRRQFTTEMNWMFTHGYHTVTMAQYVAWVRNRRTLLPARPFLIVADNGIGSFLLGAQPVLEHYRYTAVAAIVTGFADGAQGHCAPHYRGYDVQPGCGRDNRGWDLTWGQITHLSPAVYSFILEAGASGHFIQVYDRHCRQFDACKVPGESGQAYQRRVRAENSAAVRALRAHLGARFSAAAWVVPYSDLGYPRCAQAACTPQQHTGPARWLVRYAASHFRVVFVEDASRNGVAHERFRDDINGWMTLPDFVSLLRSFLHHHDFVR